jgi:hypothetical protein
MLLDMLVSSLSWHQQLHPSWKLSLIHIAGMLLLAGTSVMIDDDVGPRCLYEYAPQQPGGKADSQEFSESLEDSLAGVPIPVSEEFSLTCEVRPELS